MNICFLTPFRYNSSFTISSDSVEVHKFKLVQNSYSYLYYYLKDSCDFIIENFNTIPFEKFDIRYKRIYFPIFFSDDLNFIPKTKNFIFGGPGVDFLYFYSKGKLCSNFSIKNLSREILGFDSSNFSIYFPIDFPTIASLPLNDYMCYKSLKYGPCSFCSITPKFIERFRHARKIDRDIFTIFLSLKKFDNINYKDLYLHLSDSCIISKEIFEYLVNFKYIKFYVNSIFHNTLFDLPECRYNNIIINISIESFFLYDLYFMNKSYFAFNDIIKIFRTLQNKGYILKTNLIINNRNNLIYDYNYVREYVKNIKNVISNVREVRFYLYPVLRSFKFEHRLNKNLKKCSRRFSDFVRLLIQEIISSGNIAVLYETDRNYWGFKC